ncbi:MAG: hypothetical protein B9S34_05350 [Opitutia bacterium Tous-C1TDCM]|nr:MAG: hypothetical protein B9S34_05350 [Opitutae bacterium Tous-C1TDCM]
MPTHSASRRRFAAASLIATVAAAAAFTPCAAAAETTVLSPFRVEAEFGLDGLRIQNSSAVLNSYLLEQQGIASLQDITGAAPNLATSNSDTRGYGDVLSLRGLANSIFFTSPSVAYVIDDVPGLSVSGYPSSLLGLESFTVKAGPQGTDYGRNAPGGVIEIKTRTPGAQHRGKVLLDYGSFNFSALQAAFDGPINTQSGYSLALGLSDRDGYITNSAKKKTADDRSEFAGRGTLFFRPDANTQIRVGLYYERARDDDGRLSSLFSPDPFSVSSDTAGQTAIERHQYSFQAKRKLDVGTLIATTSRQSFDVDPSVTDLDLSPFPAAFSRVLQNEETWTQELRFESTPTADKTQWRAGLFYFDHNTDGNALRQFIVPPSAFVPPNFVQTERTLSSVDQTGLAGYVNADLPISAQTLFKVGARLENARSEIDRTKAASNSFGFPSPQDPRLRADQSNTTLSASAGLAHNLSKSLGLHARTSVAQKPRGYSAFTGNPALAAFKQERQWANEIGLTFGAPKDRFGGSLLAFYTKVRDYQFERTVPNSTDFIVVNAAEVLSRGFEAKVVYSPVDRVWLDLQAGYAEATFEDHRDATGASVNGKQVPYVPRSTLRAGVTVDLTHGFSANAGYAAVGRTAYDERNTARFVQKSYGIVHAQLRYRSGQWTGAVYAQNLFQKDYYQFINPEIFAGAPGAPRRVGVQLSFEY